MLGFSVESDCGVGEKGWWGLSRQGICDCLVQYVFAHTAVFPAIGGQMTRYTYMLWFPWDKHGERCFLTR